MAPRGPFKIRTLAFGSFDGPTAEHLEFVSRVRRPYAVPLYFMSATRATRGLICSTRLAFVVNLVAAPSKSSRWPRGVHRALRSPRIGGPTTRPHTCTCASRGDHGARRMTSSLCSWTPKQGAGEAASSSLAERRLALSKRIRRQTNNKIPPPSWRPDATRGSADAVRPALRLPLREQGEQHTHKSKRTILARSIRPGTRNIYTSVTLYKNSTLK